MTLIDQVRRAGVVGGGGSPTWLKLTRSAEIVVANAVECTPLARADRGALAKYPAEIARGLRLAMQVMKAEAGILAVREDLRESADAVGAIIAADPWLRLRVKVVFVPAVYPAGEERQVALTVTGRAAPKGGTPLDVGVAVLGVRTLLAIDEAARAKPSTHQLVAVMGAVRKPATVWAPRGIAIEKLVAAAGGASVEAPMILPGGPLYGSPAPPGSGLRHGTSLVVVLPKDHAAARKHEVPLSVHLRRGLAACENCSQCTQLCPANLVGQPVEPHKVMRAVAHGLDGMAEAIASAAFCVGCGLCTAYACPVGLAPSIVTMAVKLKLAEGGYVTPLGTGSGEAKPEWADRRVPLERLLTRLDLARYDVPAPIAGTVAADRVVVPIELPSGLLAAPIVRDGHRVKAGQKIADVPENAPGVPILASLTGSVRLTPQGIEITA
jgi:Na+-translocating ferredoxin:NAD+ oxidoreductase RnfC subunit